MPNPVLGGSSTPVHLTGHGLDQTEQALPVSQIPGSRGDISSYLDAFYRLRVSSPVTLFDSQQTYNAHPLLWEHSTASGGVVAHNAVQGLSVLTTDTTNGSQAIRQTREYFRYQPGKSQIIFLTGVFAAPKNNVVQRYGYFDANDGMFWEVTSEGMRVVLRSSVSGVPVNTSAPQDQWNLDTLDGQGPSGVTIDFTKTQIFVIDFEALYVGRVRWGVVIDGVIVYCHQAVHANILLVPYIRTANLPIRAEITNTGVAGSSTSFNQICCSVISEGGFESERGIPHSANNGVAGISVSTRRAVLSISPVATFNSIVNRGQILPTGFMVFSRTEDVLYEIVYGGTITSPSWTAFGSNSIVQVDVAGTTVSGGEVVDSGYVPSGVGTGAAASRGAATPATSLLSKLPLVNNIAGGGSVGVIDCSYCINWNCSSSS